MSKRTLAALRAAYQENKNTENNSYAKYYPFYNMKDDERCVIRFVPDLDESNPLGFLIENKYHMLTVNGKKRRVPSLTMWGEDCPISKVASDYYKVDDKENGKKYYRKISYIGQVLVVEDPLPAGPDGETFEGKLAPISLGFQIYNIIKSAFADDELESIPYGIGGEDDDADEWGYDFIIKKTSQGDYASYAIGTKFANRPRPLTEQEINTINEGRIELKSLLPAKPTREKVEALLNADLNGEDYDDGLDSSDNDDTNSKPSAPTKTATKSTKQVTKESDDGDDVGQPSKVEDMLSQIRARNRAKSAE